MLFVVILSGKRGEGNIMKLKVIMLLIFLFLIGKGFMVTIFAEKLVMDILNQPLDEKVYVKGVVDRMEDGEKVVILVEEWKLELMVEESEFDIGLIPHIWLDITLSEGEIVDIAIDWKRTNWERNRLNGLLEKLR